MKLFDGNFNDYLGRLKVRRLRIVEIDERIGKPGLRVAYYVDDLLPTMSCSVGRINIDSETDVCEGDYIDLKYTDEGSKWTLVRDPNITGR